VLDWRGHAANELEPTIGRPEDQDEEPGKANAHAKGDEHAADDAQDGPHRITIG
jgi:hypothetical protein